METCRPCRWHCLLRWAHPIRRCAVDHPETEHYKFFNHASCEFYPCHDMPAEQLNCLFCYCPLYCLGDTCGGNFRYVGEHGDIKDCSACTVPHRVENFDYIMRQYQRVKDIAARREGA
ncbi:cysteine-rich small domain-containing protein [Collinsella tanakaei]|nr:cysteine-rich small domain-containing protein [Collinsella tanakaei]